MVKSEKELILTQNLGNKFQFDETSIPKKLSIFTNNNRKLVAQVEFKDIGNSLFISKANVHFPRLGIGKVILSNLHEYALSENKESLSLTASNVGSYTWARMGFVPDAERWKYIKGEVIKRLESHKKSFSKENYENVKNFLQSSSNPKNIFVISDIPEFGEKLLKGLVWKGELSFRDNDSMQRFLGYSHMKKKDLDKIEKIISGKEEYIWR